MSWIAPLNRTDKQVTEKVYLGRCFPAYLKNSMYTSVTDPRKATRFPNKEAAEAAQIVVRKSVDALPKAPEWDMGYVWPTIELLPVEEV